MPLKLNFGVASDLKSAVVATYLSDFFPFFGSFTPCLLFA